MTAGMKYGEMRFGPFVSRVRPMASRVGKPPSPTPMMVPTISFCSSFGSSPELLTASSAAAMA